MNPNEPDQIRFLEAERDGYRNIAARLSATLFQIAGMNALDVEYMQTLAGTVVQAARLEEMELTVAAARRERNQAIARLEVALRKLAELEVLA